MIGRQYLVQQATILLRMARTVHDPSISGSLAAKAADLTSRLDGPDKDDPPQSAESESGHGKAS